MTAVITMRGVVVLFLVAFAAAESGSDGWLRYAPWPPDFGAKYKIPSSIVVLNSTATSPVNTAGLELQKGIQGIFGEKVTLAQEGNSSSSILVGTADQYTKAYGSSPARDLQQDGFWLSTMGDTVQIIGQNERGALYGAFEYLSMLARGNLSRVAYTTNPSQPIRWVNPLDNLDGTIERRYAGSSNFIQSGHDESPERVFNQVLLQRSDFFLRLFSRIVYGKMKDFI